jgi:class 3 adenylate cyclase
LVGFFLEAAKGRHSFKGKLSVKRRMAAIMVGDIVGYSAMMEKSEEKTVARLATCQTLISETGEG